MTLDCGHEPTYRLGHAYSPDAATRAMTGAVNAADCRCECGQPYAAHGVGTGSATDGRTGRTYCYPCANVAESAAFLASDTYLGYDTPTDPVAGGSRRDLITTWTGGELARVTHRWIGRGGFGSRMVYLRAIAPDGSRWHGRHSADWSEAVTLHRSKS